LAYLLAVVSQHPADQILRANHQDPVTASHLPRGHPGL